MKNTKLWKWVLGLAISLTLFLPSASVLASETEQGEQTESTGQAEEAAEIPVLCEQMEENGFQIDADGVLVRYTGSGAEVVIPSSVTSIGEYAFCRCSSLTSVTIPESVTSIGKGVFVNCSSLMNVTIPESVVSIAADAFDGCGDNLTIYGKENSCAQT